MRLGLSVRVYARYVLKKKWTLSERLQRLLGVLPYVVLTIFVFVLPLLLADAAGIKPAVLLYAAMSGAGTLEGCIPLLLLDKTFFWGGAVGGLFYWKLILLFGILSLAVIIYRPFCRYLCPLGAVY